MTEGVSVSHAVHESLSEPFPWPRQPFSPPDVYGWLRAERPVTRIVLGNGQPAWLVSRYDDVRMVLADPRVSADMRLPGYPRFGARPPSERERNFLQMDPPEHTVFRRAAAGHFTVKRAELLRPRIQALVDEVIDGMLASEQRQADLVEAVALPVPLTVLGWILGLPPEDLPLLNRIVDQVLNRKDGDPLAVQRAMAAGAELRGYIAAQVAERLSRDDQSDDVLGSLAVAVKEGATPERGAVSAGMLFILGGHETAAAMAAMAVLTLLVHPDQLDLLRSDPDLVPGAVEELLRYLTVVHLVILRVAREDIEVDGQVIPAGEAIIPLSFSANRDDAHYPGADQLDVRRGARDHLAFGYGVHLCIGQNLARVELQVILGTLLRRVPTLRLAVPLEQIQFKTFAQVYGVRSLPVAW